MLRLIGSIVLCGVIFCSTVSAQHVAGLEMKSPQKAVNLSLLGTLIPVGLGIAMVANDDSERSGGPAMIGALCIMGGILVGPGLGHSYAGSGGRMLSGIGLRLLGFGGAMTAFALSWNSPDSDSAEAGFYGGMALAGFSAIYDIATADDTARKYNERHGLSRVTVSPTYFADHDAGGLTLTLTL